MAARSEAITSGNPSRAYTDATGDTSSYVAVPSGTFGVLQAAAPSPSGYTQEQPAELMYNNNGQILLTVPQQ